MIVVVVAGNESFVDFDFVVVVAAVVDCMEKPFVVRRTDYSYYYYYEAYYSDYYYPVKTPLSPQETASHYHDG